MLLPREVVPGEKYDTADVEADQPWTDRQPKLVHRIRRDRALRCPGGKPDHVQCDSGQQAEDSTETENEG